MATRIAQFQRCWTIFQHNPTTGRWEFAPETPSDWNYWDAGRVFPDAGRYMLEAFGGDFYVRQTTSGENIDHTVFPTIINIEEGKGVLALGAPAGSAIILTPL